MRLTDLRLLDDNVLVRFDWMADAQEPERLSKGGIIIPKTAEAVTSSAEAVPAVVVAAGPGHYHDRWYDAQRGLSQDGSRRFIAMNPDVKPGARILVDAASAGDRVYDESHNEYRMIKEHNILAILDDAEAAE